MKLQRITPCLWFDRQAEEAAKFYIGIFSNSKILRTSYYGKEGYETHKMPEGTVLTVEFELEGQRFTALNGGPAFKFTEAVSFTVNCDTQQEIDYYWEKLSAGGDPSVQQCGWLKDKFGLSWQVTPVQLPRLLADKDREKAGRVMTAMMRMKKFDLKKIEEAANEVATQPV